MIQNGSEPLFHPPLLTPKPPPPPHTQPHLSCTTKHPLLTGFIFCPYLPPTETHIHWIVTVPLFPLFFIYPQLIIPPICGPVPVL